MNIKSKKGFTIIEVVLVLAIAGLIFLMVFIALPAMQRSQRDTQRRNDYSALSTAITNYMTNNNGRFPGTCATHNSGAVVSSRTGICKDTTKYINSQDNNTNQLAEDPTGNDYVLEVTGTVPTTVLDAATTDTGSKVYIVQGAACGKNDEDETIPVAKSGSRNFVVYAQLETGAYCLASQ